MPGGKKSSAKKIANKKVAIPKTKRLTARRIVAKPTVKRKRVTTTPVRRIKSVKTVLPPTVQTPLPQPVIVHLESSGTITTVNSTNSPKSWWRLVTVFLVTGLALSSILFVEDKTLLAVNDVANVPIITIPEVNWSVQDYSFGFGQCNLAIPVSWSMSATTDQAITWLDTAHPTTTITMTSYPSTQTIVEWLKQYQTPYFFDGAKQALPALSDRHGLLFIGRNGAGEPLEILYWSSNNIVIEIIVTNPNSETNATILNTVVQEWNCTASTELAE